MAKFSIFLVVVLVSISALNSVDAEEKKAHFQRKKLEKSRYFKSSEAETDNGIDHGPEYKTKQRQEMEEEEGTPITKKKQQLSFGHKDEQHWEPKKNDQNRKRKNHSKVRPGETPSEVDADLKLQDLAYEGTEQTQPKRERKQKPKQRVEGKETPEKVRQHKEQKAHNNNDKKAVHKDMRKAIKKEIKQAMEKGMTPDKIYEKFAAEQKYPKKIYTKVLQKYVDSNNPHRESVLSPMP